MKFASHRLLKLASWTTGAYATSQALRLTAQVIIARLLSPELFGIMLIVNTLRTGIDLLSDIGIGQNVVSNPNAEKKEFYDTAWTLQLIRGLLLCLLCSAAAIPLARWYDAPILATALPLASLYFVFGGLESIGRFLLQKRVSVARASMFEVGVALATNVAVVIFAFISPTIWALVWGGVFSNVALMVASYFMIPGMRHRLYISKEYARQIFLFGKWVFLATLVYFLATNFDRLYMAKVIPLAVLGVYGIARSLTDLLSTLVLRFGSQIVFPIVASSDLSRNELSHRIAKMRFRCLAVAALATSVFPVISGTIVHLLYDARYHAAASMMPALSISVWFGILCTLNEAILLGVGRPIYGALANTTKFICLCIVLPLGVAWYGLSGAIAALVLAEVARYVPVWVAQKREGLSFARQDVMLTLGMFVMIALWLTLLRWAGWESNFPLLPTAIENAGFK